MKKNNDVKCGYCGKTLGEHIKGNRSVSLYAKGERIAVYCSPDCMAKACKRMSRLVKKLSREELIKLCERVTADREAAK